jgi:siroheme synthase-like protein
VNLYPVYLSLSQASCLVVGGGRVALRKIKPLVTCGAWVTVISPEACPGLLRLARQGRVRWIKKRYASRDVSGQRLVVAATDDEGINARVSADAQRHGVWVNVADDPRRCTVILPSVVRINPLVVTVTTQGRFPGLAKKMRRELTPQLRVYARQTRVLARLRDALKTGDLHAAQRQRLMKALVSPRIMRLVERGMIRTVAQLRERAGNR